MSVDDVRAQGERERVLREALAQVEWVYDGEWLRCALCDQVMKNGHAPDCLVGMALGRLPGEKPVEVRYSIQKIGDCIVKVEHRGHSVEMEEA